MEEESTIGTYGNVDDYIWDMSFHTIKSIIYSAKHWSSDESIKNFEIPNEKIHEWHDKLWHFDVTEWRPRIDDRAVGTRQYTNKLIDVLEIKAYDLKDEIREYLEAMTAPKTEKKSDE
jgi:hypothetical protein